MTKLTDVAKVIRSKNSSPFELTLDIIFADAGVYERVRANEAISPSTIADLYGIAPERVHRVIYFDPAHAVKITLARPLPSGAPGDTDVYGAQQHGPLLTLTLDL